MAFAHEPVMLSEVVDAVVDAQPELIVDCTLGGAGHAAALLDAATGARLIGIDRDPEAVVAATKRLAPFGARVRIVHGRFSELRDVVAGERVGALIADLGVSSHQLDTIERGFSFRGDAVLDMRMDPTGGETARDILARIDERDLATAIRSLGEERCALRVSRAILAAAPTTTAELAFAIRAIVPRSRDGIDPATRTFQALRMLVNRELDELAALLGAVPDLLADGGVACVISFHSLEDRAVKTAFRHAASRCECPPSLPICLCGLTPTLEILTKRPRRAGLSELQRNPRSRSAKLRVARRIRRPS
ncbi:MAG: 16S rRNA (cytosine(1402)-N(4))-methyltransferase RsmH [Myxococcota bacterium]